MARPKVTVTRVDGALGIEPAETDQINAHVGTCSAGTANVLTPFTDIPTVRSTFGYGDLVEALCEDIADNGMAYGMRVTSDVAGVTGTVTEVGTSPAITASGTPNDRYQIRGTIVTGGAIGTSTVAISLDGGNNTAAPIATAATITPANTGVTISFAAGTYNAGDSFSFDCESPYYTASALTAVSTALQADTREYGCLHFAGTAHGAADSDKATACELIAVAAGGIITALAGKVRYCRAVVDAPDVAASALVTAFASFSDDGTLVAAGFADVTSPVSNLTTKRPIGATYCARVAGIAPHKHPGEVRRGSLPSRIVAIHTTDADGETLEAARFIALRQHAGKNGFFIADAPTMATVGSDYSLHPRCRVIDLASKVGRAALLEWLLTDLDFKGDNTGSLTDVQANAIDNDLDTKLRAALVATGYATAAYAKVNRTNDVAGTETLLGKFRVQPKGYARFITFSLGFTRGS